MGILDWLKEQLHPPSDVLAMEPQCLRHRVLTVRLPVGWQFTRADSWRFTATGPGGCSAEFTLRRIVSGGTAENQIHMKANEVEGHRQEIIQMLRDQFLKGDVKEMKAPEGVLWLEQSDVEGQNSRLLIAILNSKPRDPEIGPPPIIHIVCTAPGGAAGGGFTAERFDALRSAMRSAEWN